MSAVTASLGARGVFSCRGVFEFMQQSHLRRWWKWKRFLYLTFLKALIDPFQRGKSVLNGSSFGRNRWKSDLGGANSPRLNDICKGI